ncbi:MAG: hypothetical protein WD274_13570 [Acidimicrobiia bacterium]
MVPHFVPLPDQFAPVVFGIAVDIDVRSVAADGPVKGPAQKVVDLRDHRPCKAEVSDRLSWKLP